MLTNGNGGSILIKLLPRGAVRSENFEKKRKNFLTNAFRFDILDKLLLREAAWVEKDWKETKKVLDKLKTT